MQLEMLRFRGLHSASNTFHVGEDSAAAGSCLVRSDAIPISIKDLSVAGREGVKRRSAR
jgi:hypothetical protein